MADNIFYTEYEPKSKNRFRLGFGSQNIPSYIVKSANRPMLESTRKEIDYINTKRYVAGKYTWSPMDITFMDPIVPSGAQEVIKWVRTHYDFTTGKAGYIGDYKRQLTLEMLGPDGTSLEKWTLKGAFIQNANFNDLDYSVDDLADITVTLSYDFAVLEY